MEIVNRSNFPSRSDSKESACNAGDLGLIPGLEGSRGKGTGIPTPVFLPGDPMDRGVWQAIVHGVAQSQTRLKQLCMDARQMVTYCGKLVCVCVIGVGHLVTSDSLWSQGP